MNLTELKAKADPILLDIWNAIVAKEDIYFAKHGKYFGFNWSPSKPVIDGLDTDFVLSKPSRNFEALDSIQEYTTKLPFQIQVIRHHGPLGHGFTAYVQAVVGGVTYWRAKGQGAHSDTFAWQVRKLTII
jgi:hypothetical protein